MNSADNPSGSESTSGDAAGAEPEQGAPHSDFAPTQAEALDSAPPDWWPESADGQCSQSAALFAASQPAPLNVV